MDLFLVLIILSVLNFGLSIVLILYVMALTRRNYQLQAQIKSVDSAVTDNLAISIMNDAEQCKRPWR